MDFNGLLRRASLDGLQSYLLDGSELLIPPPERGYAERLEAAQKNIQDFFGRRYTDISEYDEIAGYFDKQAETFREVYFEVGLITGAKLAYQLRGRIGELEGGEL